MGHLVRGRERRANLDKATRLHKLRYDEGIPAILGGPLQDLEEREPREIDSGLGKLMCVGIRGSGVSEYKPTGFEMSLPAAYWLNRKAPFGVVAGGLEASVIRGAPPQSTKLKFKIAETGEEATSRLPDAE